MDNLNFKLDKNKCIKCGQCKKICSNFNIDFDTEGYPYAIQNKCFGCQHCFAICPTGALSTNPLCIDMGKCTFCGKCARCSEAVKFTNGYKLTSSSRDKLIVKPDMTYEEYQKSLQA